MMRTFPINFGSSATQVGFGLVADFIGALPQLIRNFQNRTEPPRIFSGVYGSFVYRSVYQIQ